MAEDTILIGSGVQYVRGYNNPNIDRIVRTSVIESGVDDIATMVSAGQPDTTELQSIPLDRVEIQVRPRGQAVKTEIFQYESGDRLFVRGNPATSTLNWFNLAEGEPDPVVVDSTDPTLKIHPQQDGVTDRVITYFNLQFPFRFDATPITSDVVKAINTCNASSFEAGGVTWPVGHIVFLAPEVAVYRSADGFTVRGTFNFAATFHTYRGLAVGWRKMVRVIDDDGNDFYDLVMKYEPTDFPDIFDDEGNLTFS